MVSKTLLIPILALNLITLVFSQSIIQIPSSRRALHRRRHRLHSDDLYCDSWRLSVETNDAGKWIQIPSRCRSFVEEYMTGDRYLSDSESVASCSLSFAESVTLAGDGKDAWVFDIDETLLSNLPYYELHGFGSETFDEASFDSWVDLAEAPALPASLNLYNELKKLGFTIVLLTGRSEHQRNVTEKNLLLAGFIGWERLFLRLASDKGKPATEYKSEKRMELVEQGFRIHGSSGDQWSDLFGFAVAERSFKLPNPISETFDEASFDEWVDLAEAPALSASLNLYNELKKLGFTIVLLTGRSEHQRNVTEKNLLLAGFTGWERLFLRLASDKGKPATEYKSEKRMELVEQGFRIHGSSGDQWSDLFGFAVAERSFKLPNPMCYIP